MARPQLCDSERVDVKAKHGALLAEFDGQRQADITQADDGVFLLVKFINGFMDCGSSSQ